MKHSSSFSKKQLLEKLQQLEAENAILKKTLQRYEADNPVVNELSLVEFQAIANIGYWSYDVQKDRFTISDEAYRLFGYEPSAIEPRLQHLIDRVHPDDIDSLGATIENSMGSKNTTIHTAEYRVVIGDEVRYLESRFKVEFDEAGKALKRLGTTMDVTARKLVELQLQHTKKQHESAQALANIGHWQLEHTGNQALYWSDQVYAIFELDKRRFKPTYENFLNVIHPQDRNELNRVFTESVTNRTQYQHIHRLLMSDGRIKYVQEIGRTSYDAAGQAMTTIGTVQDITLVHKAKLTLQQTYEKMKLSIHQRSGDLDELSEQVKQGAINHVRMEKELRAEQDFNKSLFEIAPVIILILDNKGNVLYFNPYMTKVTGFRLSEVKGKSWFKTFIPDNYQDALRILFGESVTGRSVKGNINPIRCKDGSLRMVEWWSSSMKNDHDEVSAVLSIGQDITENYRLQDELETERLMLRTLIEESTAIICYKNRQGQWLKANHALLNLFGLNNIQYKGLSNQELVKLADPLVRDIFKICTSWECAVWEGGQPITRDLIVPQPDGSSKIYQITKKPVYTELNQAEALLVIGHEITVRETEERKRLEELGKQKDTLVREVHHRIKNHLQGLTGLLYLRKTSYPEYSQVIDEMINQVNSIGTVYGLQSQSKQTRVNLFDMLAAIIKNAEKFGNQ